MKGHYLAMNDAPIHKSGNIAKLSRPAVTVMPIYPHILLTLSTAHHIRLKRSHHLVFLYISYMI